MKTAFIAFLCASVATPALAWNNTNGGHNNQIVDGGPGAQANQRQTATGGSASSTGGNAAGGSAQAFAGSSDVTVNGAGGGGAGRAPDVFLPSIGGGGMDCPTVGFGAGGSGLGGGGGFGPSWISPDCNNRKLAELLWQSGRRDAALRLLSAAFPQVRKALAADSALGAPTAPWSPAPWCATASEAERHRHYQDCYRQ